MNDLEMAAKFREAADYLRVHGWRQTIAAAGPGEPTCAVGALARVCGHVHKTTEDTWLGWIGRQFRIEDLYDEPLYRLARERVGGEVAFWNDDFRRTKEEVIALFEGLAHDLELRHQIAATSPLPAESRHDAIIPSLEAVAV